MATISRDQAIKILHQKGVSLFTTADARKLFPFEKDNSFYKLLQRLEKSHVIERIAQGKYQFLLKEADDFELANFLATPSYISLESALSFYGILSQFPYSLTSVTPLKSRKVIYKNKEYEFAHLEKKYFWGFVRKNNFLMASPEKALLDELYFLAKKLRTIHLEDLDLSRLNKKEFQALAENINFLPLRRLLKELKLC